MAVNEAMNRMLDRLSEKMETNVGYRGDIHIADYRPLSKRAGVLLVGYSSGLPSINSDDLSKFILRTFDGKAIPDMVTAKLHKLDNAVSVVIKQYQPTKKLEAKKQMVTLASTMFLDTDLGETWEQKEKDGVKFLARLEKEQLDDIVSARRDRMQVKASNLTLASIGSGVPVSFREGDSITYYKDGCRREGQILGIYDSGIKVQAKEGRVHAITVDEILDVNDVSPTEKKKLDKNMRDYYQTIFGEDYAKLLTPDA